MKAVLLALASLALVGADTNVVQQSGGANGASTSTTVVNGKSLVVTNGVAYSEGKAIAPAPASGWNTVTVTSQCNGGASVAYSNTAGQTGQSSSIVNACGGGGGNVVTSGGGDSVVSTNSGGGSNVVNSNSGGDQTSIVQNSGRRLRF